MERIKQIKFKRITCKNEREHNKYFKIMRWTLFIITLPIIAPMSLLIKIGEIAECVNCAIVRVLEKGINNLFKIIYFTECRNLDEWEIEELQEEEQRKKMKKEKRGGKYYVN